ncbi:hypothetical protein GALMADRAFT_138030 [Galerina marginata CBS 339.88]|uniref:Uncharacterized protein n=1 Tax=Galerina marginata (strain CBS 339.88) TaxID=685588 RepID=A0A067TGP0_GALM3|nr:hypothetical protein GALMADRAFT_138030 [Galerina marginata CBS 339.88]
MASNQYTPAQARKGGVVTSRFANPWTTLADVRGDGNDFLAKLTKLEEVTTHITSSYIVKELVFHT